MMKPVSEFHANRARADGVSGYCARCQTAIGQERDTKLRVAVLAKLGGACKRCGFSDPRALVIDHVNGDGYIQRREGLQGTRLYRAIIQDRVDLTGYQVLCANCNAIKRIEDGEHVGARVYERLGAETFRPSSRKWTDARRRQTAEALQKYYAERPDEDRQSKAQSISATKRGAPRYKGDRWSLRYDACVDCGRDTKPHAGRGFCSTCVQRARRARRAQKQET